MKINYVSFFHFMQAPVLSAIELQNRGRVKHYFRIGKLWHSLNAVGLVSRVIFEPRRIIVLLELILQISEELAFQASLAHAYLIPHNDIIRR